MKVSDESTPLIFSTGLPVARVDKGIKNSVVLSVFYVVESSIQEEIPIFDKNPAGNGQGFFSINNCEFGCANKIKEITIPVLKDKEKFTFYTFINYRNRGSINIQNAKVKMSFDYISNENELQIRSELSGENVLPVYDLVKIKNQTEQRYNLNPVSGYLFNNHEENSPYQCKGYAKTELVDVSNLLTEKILIGTLDTYKNGWCDEGYFVTKWEVKKDDYQ